MARLQDVYALLVQIDTRLSVHDSKTDSVGLGTRERDVELLTAVRELHSATERVAQGIERIAQSQPRLNVTSGFWVIMVLLVLSNLLGPEVTQVLLKAVGLRP